MNTYPCNQNPVKFVNCCQVMDCIDIKSSDNSVTVEKSECGVDLTITGNNLDQILKINNGTCISFVKEFVDGVLNITPVIDFTCLAASICGLCPPPVLPVFCPTPLTLSVTAISIEDDFLLINSGDNFLINTTDILTL